MLSQAIKRKLSLVVAGSLLSGMVVAIAVPTTAKAIAPVGATSTSVFLINGIPTGGIGVATINAASAVAMTDQEATAAARSVGLAVQAATTTGITSTATVQLGGTLSLFNLSATSMAYTADGGTFSSPVAAGFTSTITSTAAAFTITSTATGATLGKAVLWTAPSTAGTYTINGYVSTQGASVTSYAAVTTTNFVVGTNFGRITVTVGGTHPAPGGTNAPDTLGQTNSSLFVAVSAASGTTGVIHPTTTLGTGEDSAKSKGLLAKSDAFGTAQTATVLSGGVLSLYGVVSTAAAFSATGGSFSGSQAGIAAEVVSYSSSNNVTVITGMVPTTGGVAGASAVATLWTAPTTAGTYTISLLTGFVQDSNATTYSAPTTSSLPPTLSGKITVTVVASAVAGYSAAYSACNTANTTVAASSTYPSGVDALSTVVKANGDSWFIDYNLRDGYNAVLDPGNIVVTATNGALVNIGTTAGTAPIAGTASTDTEYGTGDSDTVIISQPTAGAPLTTTVTITYNGTTVCTKTVTIRGKVATLEVSGVGTGSLSSEDGSTAWIQSQAGGVRPAGLFLVVARDSAGNLVNTNATLGTYSAVTSTLTTVVQNVRIVSPSSSVTSSTSVNRFNVGTWYCGDTAGSANVKIKFTTAATGEVVESPAIAARCAGSPYTFTVALDRSSYIIGDLVTATVQFLDSKGNKANSVAAPGASTWTMPMFTAVDYASSATAVTKADGTAVYKWTVGTTGTFAAGTYTGVISYSGLAFSTNATPTYKVVSGGDTTSNADILKSIVALIASINKQIQALQKLILKR